MNSDEPLRTKNLADEDPAPMDDTLGGYPWLPRMIDKARAANADKLGDYFKYPCPIDQHCLRLLGVTSDQFQTCAASATDGRMVLITLHALGASPPDLVKFDPVELNRVLHSAES